ncbi:MAG: hypothetical protein CVU06_10020 [Bacteroidetes bacterium HGW-Bacteroidetes-22]|nr:MAG: hypothetical protein CVU06_10020 [Bacteroidetes bacterium HGW-Bacteroidetes-22]
MTELVLVSANQATGKIERSIEGLKGNDFIMNPNNTSGDMIANDPHQLKFSTQRVMLKKKKKNSDAPESLRTAFSGRPANRPWNRLRGETTLPRRHLHSSI